MAQFGNLGIAEIRSYPWDGVVPVRTAQGWTDLYGTPYSVLFNPGVSNVPGGWVDVRSFTSIQVVVHGTGGGAGVVGLVVVNFEAAFGSVLFGTSAQSLMEIFSRADLVANVSINGTTEIKQANVIDVENISYLRVSGVNNLTAGQVTIRVVCPDTIKPVQ